MAGGQSKSARNRQASGGPEGPLSNLEKSFSYLVFFIFPAVFVSVWPLQIFRASRSIIGKQYVKGFCDYPERQGATTTFEGDNEDSRLGPQLLKPNHASARSCRNRFCATQYV